MQSLHPYQYMRSQRIEIVPSDTLSYSVSRYGEDDDVRYAFGVCGKADREHIGVAEIDLAWLGVVFHIVVTSESETSRYGDIYVARDEVAEVKGVAKEIVVQYMKDHAESMVDMLETIHQASREQGHLEVVKHTVNSMVNKPSLSWGNSE